MEVMKRSCGLECATPAAPADFLRQPLNKLQRMLLDALDPPPAAP